MDWPWLPGTKKLLNDSRDCLHKQHKFSGLYNNNNNNKIMSHSVGTSVGTGKGSTSQDLVYQPLQNDIVTHFKI